VVYRHIFTIFVSPVFSSALCLCHREASAVFSLLVTIWAVAMVAFSGKRRTKQPEKDCHKDVSGHQKEAPWEHLTLVATTVLQVLC
jgi:hypothetical protein